MSSPPALAKTTLVLLPGMDGTGEQFQPFLRALGPSTSTVVISYPTAEPLTYAELEAVVRPKVRSCSWVSPSLGLLPSLSQHQTHKASSVSCSVARSPQTQGPLPHDPPHSYRFLCHCLHSRLSLHYCTPLVHPSFRPCSSTH